MNKAQIEALTMIKEGIDLLISASEEQAVSSEPKTPTVERKGEVNAEKETTAPIKGNLTREQLDSMTYNDLKKLAKELGVSAVGARPEITARILGEEVTVEEEAVEEVINEDVSPEDTPTGDEVADKVREAVAEMSVEDLADILAEVGISAKGKRETLVEKIINAVKDGLIAFDDEEAESVDEGTDEPNVAPDDEPETAEEVSDEDEDYDPTNDPENPDMTKKRKTALVAFESSTKASVEDGEISYEDMRTFLAEFHDMKVTELEEYTDDEILEFYIDAASRFIDDDGEIVEEEAYMLNGQPACCGHHLEYDESTGKFTCSICKNEYEAE